MRHTKRAERSVRDSLRGDGVVPKALAERIPEIRQVRLAQNLPLVPGCVVRQPMRPGPRSGCREIAVPGA